MRDNPVRRITVDERRARLSIRHHLAPAARGADVTEVARDLGAEAVTAIEAAAARLSRWFGAVRVIPKFRTPLERQLSG